MAGKGVRGSRGKAGVGSGEGEGRSGVASGVSGKAFGKREGLKDNPYMPGLRVREDGWTVVRTPQLAREPAP